LLSGSLPTTSDGIVERKVCKVGFSSCCSKEYDVQIKHCGTFHAYCLGALDSCSERYCFGKQGLCEYPTASTTSTTTTSKPTTVSPPTTCSEDPCIESNLQTLTQTEYRSMNCGYKQGRGYCDDHLTAGWYKADSPIMNQCPKLLSCGSIYPVWMNGSVPNIGDGVVTRQACQRGFHSCCSKSYDIKVKNCGKYTAYCLKGLDTCPSRYCFGDQPCGDDKRKSDSDGKTNFDKQ
ncbi:uromodulin-like, partial [Saccostrea echinata]|uniref:uromodulin-like n=1 Tax=Saccostrea echinata TaxID=191078 RepID=UPI002A82490F